MSSGTTGRVSRHSLATALAAVTALCIASACARTPETEIAPAGGMLFPGAPELAKLDAPDRPAGYRIIMDRLPTGAPVHRDFRQVRTDYLPASYHGASAFLIVASSATFVDSSLVLRNGLAPVWEIQHVKERRTRYDYNGNHVRRKVTAPDTAATSGESTYPYPVFHFNELTDVVRSLPLRAGYHAILPLYSEGDNALETDTVRVEGQDSAGIWKIRFADKVIISHYGIDGATRRMVHCDIERHADRAHYVCVMDEK